VSPENQGRRDGRTVATEWYITGARSSRELSRSGLFLQVTQNKEGWTADRILRLNLNGDPNGIRTHVSPNTKLRYATASHRFLLVVHYQRFIV
jgi:hypothetical protein